MYEDKAFWKSKKFKGMVVAIVAMVIQNIYGVPETVSGAIIAVGFDIVVGALATFYVKAQGKIDEKLAEK